jgi:hypothetical protein
MTCCHHIHSLLHGYFHPQFLSSYSKSVVNIYLPECCRLVVSCCIIDGKTFLQPQLVLCTNDSLLHTHIYTYTHTYILLRWSYFNLRQPIPHSVLLISRDDSSETEQKSPKEKMLQNLDYCMTEKWSFRVLF